MLFFLNNFFMVLNTCSAAALYFETGSNVHFVSTFKIRAHDVNNVELILTCTYKFSVFLTHVKKKQSFTFV